MDFFKIKVSLLSDYKNTKGKNVSNLFDASSALSIVWFKNGL